MALLILLSSFVHASGTLVTATGLCKPGWMDLWLRTSAPYSSVHPSWTGLVSGREGLDWMR